MTRPGLRVVQWCWVAWREPMHPPRPILDAGVFAMPDLLCYLDAARAADWCAAARELSAEQAERALVAVAALERALSLRLRAGKARANQAAPALADRLLTAQQVAGMFGRSVDWAYRMARGPWRSIAVREGRGTVRFPEEKLRRHLAAGGSTARVGFANREAAAG